jgi:hypothetical protein
MGASAKESAMLKNVGTVDRAIRVLAGLALIAATWLGYIGSWGWVGVVPLATGMFSFCPVYRLLGLNTCTARTAIAKPS